MSITQGDIIVDCPIVDWKHDPGNDWSVQRFTQQVIVLTQACDLVNEKTTRVQVAVVHEAEKLVAASIVKATAIRDQIRTHRVFGLYFLPAFHSCLSESVVDLRDIHTLPKPFLMDLILQGKRVARLCTPYREHLAQHFAVTFSRIALPHPYDTQ